MRKILFVLLFGCLAVIGRANAEIYYAQDCLFGLESDGALFAYDNYDCNSANGWGYYCPNYMCNPGADVYYLNDGDKVRIDCSIPASNVKVDVPSYFVCSHMHASFTVQEICNTCNVSPNSSWTAAGAGYEKSTTYRTCADECECDSCYNTTQYRCAANYYGSSADGTTGCAQCPEDGRSNAGSLAITLCYIPLGATGTDNYGSYEIADSDCYYAQ
ncbi:MAG: hypothetical protein LBJ73_01985 [Rickettsiales bacterium]|nr:hypothetical protein [Rickettsiales bacterium]